MSDTNEAEELLAAWRDLEAVLPPRHTLLITGPTKSGTYNVGVVRNIAPTKQLASGRGPIAKALRVARLAFVFLPESE